MRCNDERYLFYLRRYFVEIAKQVTGLLFKDGGPVIGLTPGRHGLLYHWLFSSQAPEFGSRASRSAAGALGDEPSTDAAQRAQDDNLAAGQWL